MKILFIAQGKRAAQSTEHRIIPVKSVLENKGHDCDVIFGKRWSFLDRPISHVSISSLPQIVLKDGLYDAIVLNRDASPLGLMCYSLSQYYSIPFIFDIDDALYKQKTISGTDIPNPTRIFLNRIISRADHVTTGSGNIHDYIETYNKNSTILPTPVNMNVFNPHVQPPREYDNIVIGWMGNGPVHEENLELLVKPLIRLGKEYDVIFRIISALDSDRIKSSFRSVEEYIDIDYGFNKWVSLKRIAAEVQTFDIAALPLNSKVEFMSGKNSTKIIEHLATKTPVVTTNFAAYGSILTHNETGLLTNSEEDWYNNLKYLIDNPEERERLAMNGYNTVKEQYTSKHYADELENILISVV